MQRALWRWATPKSCSLSTASEVSHNVSTAIGAKATDCTVLRDTQSRIMAATILARNPLILRPLSEFELAYEDYRQVLQAERSRATFDIMTAQRRELEELRGNNDGVTKSERSPVKSERIVPPNSSLHPVYKEADLDPTSLMRHLERKLYFVVKNERGQWQFPAVHVPTAETGLHKLTAHAMRRLLGEECELYPMGMAPVAYHSESLNDRVAPPYMIKVSSPLEQSQLISGKLKFHPELGASSFAWLTREELQGLLLPVYFKSISRVLAY